MSTTYVRFTNIATGAVVVGGGTNGWTPVDSTTFDATLADGLSNQAQQSATFAVPLADSGVAAQVEAGAAAGTGYQVEIASYDASNRLTSDYVLTPSLVTADQATVSRGSDLLHTLTLKTGGYTSTTTSYDSSGAATTTTGGYSFIAQKSMTMPAPSAPSDPTALQTSASADAHMYAPNIDTYLVLQNSDGSYIKTSRATQFAKGYASNDLPASNNNLGDYTGDLIEPQNFVTGLSLGKNTDATTFSYSAPADSQSPLLFQTLAKGGTLKSVELIQHAGNNVGQVVSDTVDNNVSVTGITYSLGDGGSNTRIYQFQDGAGNYVTSHDNTSSASTVGSFALTAPATVASGVQAPLATSQASVYKMTVTSGTSSNVSDISSSNFSVQRSGANTTFSDLTVTYDQMPGAATVASLSTAGAGTELSIAQMKSGGSSGGDFTYDTLTFATAQAPTVAVTPNGNGTSSYTYDFKINGFQETYQDQPGTPNGQSTTSDMFSTVQNADGSTSLMDTSNPCFASDTTVCTTRGDVVVEKLAIGDFVVTASGEHRPICWVGHRTVDCGRHPRPNEVMPIRIAAHAFGDNRPTRDLFVSPGHSICVDVLGDVLIPAGALVNGATISQVHVDEVTYWHVELYSHDIILAENLPAESYLDMGNRGFFAQEQVVDLAAAPDPDAAQHTHADFCRPFHADGPVVDAVKAQLRRRAETLGWRLARADELGGLHLVVDGVQIETTRRGASVCFALPPGAGDIWMMSSALRPCDIGDGGDVRKLGLGLGAITLVDGFETRVIGLDDPRLGEGLYDIERDGNIAWRWTDGRARLPAALWADCIGPALVRLDFVQHALPHYVAPAADPETSIQAAA